MERQLLQPKELSVERKVSMLLANCIVLCNLKDPLSCLCEFRSENNTEVYAKPIVVLSFFPKFPDVEGTDTYDRIVETLKRLYLKNNNV